jgi:hypothetical protein
MDALLDESKHVEFRERKPKLYCGDKEILPQGYAGFGTRYQCLRKGVGTGMMMDSKKQEAFKQNVRPRVLEDDELNNIARQIGVSTDGKSRDQIFRDIIIVTLAMRDAGL